LRRFIIIVFVCSVFGSAISSAEIADPTSPSDSNYDLNLYLENDTRRFSLSGSDRNYTSGLRVSYLYAEKELPGWGKALSWLIPEASSFNYGFAFGQHMYTPEDIGRADLIPDDRPYAGWLYLGFLLHLRRQHTLHSFEVDLGVIGPPALGEPAQKAIHSVLRIRQPNGWANQLKTEPGVSLYYQQKYKWIRERLFGGVLDFDVIPDFGAALGNVFIYAGAGGTARLGFNLSNNFGATRLSPLGMDPFIEASTDDDPASLGPVEIYLFASVAGRGVLRNIFLDGNTFTSSHRVDKKPFVFEHEWGFLVRVSRIRLTWRQVTRSPEFPQDGLAHVFGSLCLSYSYRF